MSEGTKIQWCDDTHNFWRGCVKVSPGCKNCYAEQSTPVRLARSEGRELWGGTLRDRAKDFDAPLRWNAKPWVCDECGLATAKGIEEEPHNCKFGPAVHQSFHRRRVFSLSLGDWLDDAVPIEWLADMLDVIRRCPNLDFLLLTKRPENWRDRVGKVMIHAHEALTRNIELCGWAKDWLYGSAPANVWPMTTVENQEWADKRIPHLLKIPAVCRGISYEPALGPIHFGCIPCGTHKGSDDTYTLLSNPLDGFRATSPVSGLYDLPRVHWIIVGGESGPKARPFDVEWARSTVEQCRAAGVACFVKQMGAKPYDTDSSKPELGTIAYGLNLTDKKGGDMAEWPEDLRVREFPTVEGARCH